MGDLELAKRKKLQRDAGIPNLPTPLTFDLRLAVGGEGPRAYEWTDKPHRLLCDACREIEVLSAIPVRDVDLRPITMQDVRLAVGEGPLTPADVLAGSNAELTRRASHRVPKADHIGRLNEMVREAEAREDEIAALVEAAAEAQRLYVQADNEVGRLRKALEPFAAFSARFPKAKGNVLPMGVHPGPPHEPTMRDFHHAHDLTARLERASSADQHTG